MVTLAFITTSALILLTPGPTNTVLAASGATFGVKGANTLPFAEALGYCIAISFFVAMAGSIADRPYALAMMKFIAAVWLVVSAVRLWKRPLHEDLSVRRGAFVRVLITTILNPKAMLVGTLLIPAAAGIKAAIWIAVFASLSTVAGFAWVLCGSLMHRSLRQHAYKCAAVVLSGFSVAAVASVFA